MEHAQFVIDAACRGLVLARVGAGRAVAGEQSVDLLDDRCGVGTRGEVDADIVERAVHVAGCGEGAVIHPHHAEAAVVRQGFAGAGLEDELGRQPDAGDVEGFAAAVDHGDQRIARAEVVFEGERLAEHHAAAIAGLGEAAAAEAYAVEPLRTAVLRE